MINYNIIPQMYVEWYVMYVERYVCRMYVIGMFKINASV